MVPLVVIPLGVVPKIVGVITILEWSKAASLVIGALEIPERSASETSPCSRDKGWSIGLTHLIRLEVLL